MNNKNISTNNQKNLPQKNIKKLCTKKKARVNLTELKQEEDEECENEVEKEPEIKKTKRKAATAGNLS